MAGATLLVLAGCGQKGPLFMPAKPVVGVAGAKAPAGNVTPGTAAGPVAPAPVTPDSPAMTPPPAPVVPVNK